MQGGGEGMRVGGGNIYCCLFGFFVGCLFLTNEFVSHLFSFSTLQLLGCSKKHQSHVM